MAQHGRGAFLALVACLVLAVAVPAGWWVSRPADDVGRPVTALAAAPAPLPSSATATARPGPTLPRLSARPARAAAERVDPPVRLSVPDVALDAPVDAVGVDRDGAMELPQDVDRVGWYRWNPTAGAEAGTTVLAGHVDDAEQGLGAMAALVDVEVGARVWLTTAAGQAVEYRVVGRQRIVKTRLPTEEIFRRDGPHRLVLVTCGGEFDRARGHYEENVVVTAEPVR